MGEVGPLTINFSFFGGLNDQTSRIGACRGYAYC